MEWRGTDITGGSEFSLLFQDPAPQLGWELHEGRDMTFSPNSGLTIRPPAQSRDPLQGPGLSPFSRSADPLSPPFPRHSTCCRICQHLGQTPSTLCLQHPGCLWDDPSHAASKRVLGCPLLGQAAPSSSSACHRWADFAEA